MTKCQLFVGAGCLVIAGVFIFRLKLDTTPKILNNETKPHASAGVIRSPKQQLISSSDSESIDSLKVEKLSKKELVARLRELFNVDNAGEFLKSILAVEDFKFKAMALQVLVEQFTIGK